MPVWARDTAFPPAPPQWGWVDSSSRQYPCDSLQALADIVSSDASGRVCLVWTPDNPHMVLPEEVASLHEVVTGSRKKWVREDLDESTSRLRRFVLFFGILFGWIFFQNYGALSRSPLFGWLDLVRISLARTLNSSTIELAFLLLVIFVIIPWYQARKRFADIGKFSTPGGLAEAVPTMRFEIWLDRQKAPVTRMFLGLMILVGLAQLLPGNATSAAGLMKDAYRQGEWWRLFTAPFLHGHPIHFAMNAAALIYLGKRLEVFARWPHLPLVFIFAAVIGGQTSAYFMPESNSVGASGGLMGWLGFLLVFETLHARLVPRSARRRLAAAVFLTAVIGLLGHRFIDNAAHAGGLIAGMLYAAIVFPRSTSAYRPQSTFTDRAAGMLAFSICTGSALLAIWKICAP